MALILAAAGIGFAVYRHEKKKRLQQEENDQEAGVSRLFSYTPDVEKRVLLAKLVAWMYDRARSTGDCNYAWKSHDYELVPLSQILTDADKRLYKDDLEKEAEYKHFGVLHKKGMASPVAPEWVVAIRGTNVQSLHDIWNDIKIWLEQLHTSSTAKLLKVVLLRMDTQFGCHKVAVAGHSLGASLGMLVTRKLALQGRAFESHFFNPPFAALGSITRSWTHKLIKKVLTVAKIEKIEKIEKMEALAAASVAYLVNGRGVMKKLYEEYKALEKWSPHLYLNHGDPICEGYISHFTKKRPRNPLKLENLDTWFSVGSALSTITLGHAETFHLFPSAVCVITKSTKFLPIIAHSLTNWADSDVLLSIKKPKLIVELNENTNELIMNEKGDDLEYENFT